MKNAYGYLLMLIVMNGCATEATAPPQTASNNAVNASTAKDNGVPLHYGELQVGPAWTTIPTGTLENPVVVAASPSNNDSRPVTTRIRKHGSSNGFEIRLVQWEYSQKEEEEPHAPETIGFLAVSQGRHTLANGTAIEAQRISSDSTVCPGKQYRCVNFENKFAVRPVVIAAVTTDNDSTPVLVRIHEVSVEGFQFHLQEEEANWDDGPFAIGHGGESIDFIAWEQSQGEIGDISFEVRRTSARVSNDDTKILHRDFAEVPTLIPLMQTSNGKNTANLRWTTRDQKSFVVHTAEELSRDSEVSHVKERVGFIVLGRNKSNGPDNETPDNETPDNETPDNETPDNETPDNETPDNETPDNETPDNETPDNKDDDGKAYEQPPGSRQIPKWGVYETTIINETKYVAEGSEKTFNKFRELELRVSVKPPMGNAFDFGGFFDGYGSEKVPATFDAIGKDKSYYEDFGGEITGNVWKIRLTCNQGGTWKYEWRFVEIDPKTGMEILGENRKKEVDLTGRGEFVCVEQNAKPGPLRVDPNNYHGFITDDGTPFFVRSFYSMIPGIPFGIDRFQAVLDKAVNRGLNLFMTNMFPIMGWTTDDQAGTLNNSELSNDQKVLNKKFLIWYQNEKREEETVRKGSKEEIRVKNDVNVYDTNRFSIFTARQMDEFYEWYYENGVYHQGFQGFAIKRSIPNHRRPDQFSDVKAQWFLKYWVRRYAAYYNIIWRYTWEVDPGKKTENFGKWIDEFDPWDHLYTVHALNNGDFNNPVYDFGSIEVGGPIYNGNANTVRAYYDHSFPTNVPTNDGLKPFIRGKTVDSRKPTSTNVGGKPIMMVEDYGFLWRGVENDWLLDRGLDRGPFLRERDRDALDKAWRLVMNGASFVWSEIDYKSFEAHETPFDDYFSTDLSRYVLTLFNYVGNRTEFWNLFPKYEHKEKLVGDKSYCLADHNRSEYLVYHPGGGAFDVYLDNGVSYSATWLDPYQGTEAYETIEGLGKNTVKPPEDGEYFVLHLTRD